MYKIIGLGNPGKKYAKTRHNVGFMVVDELATRNPKLKNRIIKPQTFMNKSGEAVKQLKAKDIIVIHDDIDLSLGTIRVRRGGSSAGHKGVQSIIDTIGPDFWRVRIGVGRPPSGMETDDYVLTNFNKNEKVILDTVIERVVEFIHNSGLQDQTISVL